MYLSLARLIAHLSAKHGIASTGITSSATTRCRDAPALGAGLVATPTQERIFAGGFLMNQAREFRRQNLMLLVSEDTRFYKPLRYLIPAIGRSDYWIWRSGGIPDGPGAWAKNAPAPDIDLVKRNPMFCAAVPNLLLRKAGKLVPTKGDERYDGGIAAYFSGSTVPAYFSGYDAPFNVRRAKRWARRSRSGVLLGSGYWGAELHHRAMLASCFPPDTSCSPTTEMASTGAIRSSNANASGGSRRVSSRQLDRNFRDDPAVGEGLR